jgi:hypothetical protein
MRKPYVKCLSWYLILAMFVIGITPRVYAGFSPSEGLSLSAIDRAAELQKIQGVLEMKMISERLRSLGFTPGEIQNRLGQLTDQQVHQLALQLDELKVGGDGLGIVVALVLIVAIVILVIYLTGHRVVVTK